MLTNLLGFVGGPSTSQLFPGLLLTDSSGPLGQRGSRGYHRRSRSSVAAKLHKTVPTGKDPRVKERYYSKNDDSCQGKSSRDPVADSTEEETLLDTNSKLASLRRFLKCDKKRVSTVYVSSAAAEAAKNGETKEIIVQTAYDE